MGSQIEYNGKNLASVHFNRGHSGRFELSLVFNSPEDAATFIKLDNLDVISLDGLDRRYGDFRKEWAEKITKAYSSIEDYLSSRLQTSSQER